MKTSMKSMVRDYGVDDKNTGKNHRNFIVTRMPIGLLRCLRKPGHNSHVCAPVCVRAQNHRNFVIIVTSQCLCGFQDYGKKKHRNSTVTNSSFSFPVSNPDETGSLSRSCTGKCTISLTAYDNGIKRLVNGSAQLGLAPSSPMGASTPATLSSTTTTTTH